MRNAIEISNSRFLSDVERLADAVGRALGETEAPKSTTSTSRRRRALLYVLCGGVASVAAIPAYRLSAPWISGDFGQPLRLRAADWRYCDKCQAMFFDGYPTKGVCAGGAHNAQGFNFMLPHDVPGPGHQTGATARNAKRCSTTAIQPRACARPVRSTAPRASTSPFRTTFPGRDNRTGDTARGANRCSSMAFQAKASARRAAAIGRRVLTSSCRTGNELRVAQRSSFCAWTDCYKCLEGAVNSAPQGIFRCDTPVCSQVLWSCSAPPP